MATYKQLAAAPIEGMLDTYKDHSEVQEGVIDITDRYVQRALDAFVVYPSSAMDYQPLTIADYGCSHGHNTVVAIKRIIKHLNSSRKDVGREILVVFNDLPTNNWSMLFEILSGERSFRYTASGVSFYESCLPRSSVSIGYSTTSIHWLSKKPCNVSDHCFVNCGRVASERQAFANQAKDDYGRFLLHRSREIMRGGILILAIISCNQEDSVGSDALFDLLYECAKHVLTNQERIDYTIPIYERRFEECVDRQLFAHLSFQLIEAKLHESPIPHRRSELSDDAFAWKCTEMLRTWCEPSLRQSLEKNGRSADEIQKITNRFWTEFADRIRQKPHLSPGKIFVTCVSLKKV